MLRPHKPGRHGLPEWDSNGMLAATDHWKHADMPTRHPHSYIEPVPELAATADVIRTPCGDGNMVWRSWGSGPVLVLLHGGTG